MLSAAKVAELEDPTVRVQQQVLGLDIPENSITGRLYHPRSLDRKTPKKNESRYPVHNRFWGLMSLKMEPHLVEGCTKLASWTKSNRKDDRQ